MIWLVRLSRGKLERSSVVNNETGSYDVHPHRTSYGTYFNRAENDLIRRLATAPKGVVPVTPVAAPVPVQPTSAPPQSQSTAVPLVAADEDLIEKEWVDKAKEIIEQTPDDPYTRTERVGELQRNYLQKRYGKVVGADDNGA